MSILTEVIGPVSNKLFVDNREVDLTNKKAFIDTKSVTTWTNAGFTYSNYRRASNTEIWNDKLYFLGYNYNYRLYSWDGTSISYIEIPENYLKQSYLYYSLIVYKDKLHIIGRPHKSDYNARYNYHISWDGTNWKVHPNPPCMHYGGSAIVYKDSIHIMCGGLANGYTDHYSFYISESDDVGSWTKEISLPYPVAGPNCVFLDRFGMLNVIGTSFTYKNNTWYAHNECFYLYNDKQFSSISISTGNNYVYGIVRNYKAGEDYIECVMGPLNTSSQSEVPDVYLLKLGYPSSRVLRYENIPVTGDLLSPIPIYSADLSYFKDGNLYALGDGGFYEVNTKKLRRLYSLHVGEV